MKVAGPNGVLLIVKNYTGDVLQFSIAMKFAEREGVKCKMVVVADDVLAYFDPYLLSG